MTPPCPPPTAAIAARQESETMQKQHLANALLAGAMLLILLVFVYAAGGPSDWHLVAAGVLTGLAMSLPTGLLLGLATKKPPDPPRVDVTPPGREIVPLRPDWIERNLADAGALAGLGNARTPYTVQVDGDGITIRLGRSASARQALAVWDGVQLATQRSDVIVIDGAGQEWAR